MPALITNWADVDQFDTLRDKTNAAIDLLDGETIDALADTQVADLAIGTTGRGQVSTDASTDFWILYGCEISGTNPGSRTVAAGAILYQNQVYHVSAKTITTTGSEVVVWDLVDNSPNVHETKELEILDGVSGTGIKDEGDPTIHRMGEWVESSTASSGLGLSFVSSTPVLYSSVDYYYKYRRVGNTLDLSFRVVANITQVTSSLTRFYIPMPDGFTKKTPNANFISYGSGSWSSPASASPAGAMQVTNYDTGSEGNKISMARIENNTSWGSTIILDGLGNLTLRGNITLEIE